MVKKKMHMSTRTAPIMWLTFTQHFFFLISIKNNQPEEYM